MLFLIAIVAFEPIFFSHFELFLSLWAVPDGIVDSDLAVL